MEDDCSKLHGGQIAANTAAIAAANTKIDVGLAAANTKIDAGLAAANAGLAAVNTKIDAGLAAANATNVALAERVAAGEYETSLDGAAPGSGSGSAPSIATCFDILQNNPSSPDSYYSIKGPNYDFTTWCAESEIAEEWNGIVLVVIACFPLYRCDMSGGGWTLVGRQQQSNHLGCEDCFYDGCGCTSDTKGTCLKNCKFGEVFAGSKGMEDTGDNFAWLNDNVKGSEQKQEFYKNGQPSGTSHNGGGYQTVTSGAGREGVASAMCTVASMEVTFWTLRRNSAGLCDNKNYNIVIGAGRRHRHHENDEICNWMCANGGGYAYLADEFRLWVK
jgi:hypothetical protein